MPTPEVIIDFEPDWNSPPEVSYAFQSVVQSTPRFVEQRRPLLPTPVRTAKYEFVLEGAEGQQLLQRLESGKSVFSAVPIFSEPITPASLVQGASSITTVDDMTYLWNIQNCDWAIVLDLVFGESELLAVSSASGTTITLSQAIAGSFTAADCVIYPAFIGVVKDFDRVPITDLLSSVSVEFEETSAEHGDAAGSWAGLYPFTCPDKYLPYNFALVYSAERYWFNHEINVYSSPENPVKVGIYLDLDLIAGIPAASSFIHSNNPWSADNSFYFLCDNFNHTFYKIKRIPSSNGSGVLVSSFSVPAVTTAGLSSRRVTGWGIQPTTGKLYVCCGAFSYRNYYRRNLIYSEPGGTLLYDSGNLYVNVATSSYPVWAERFFFIGANVWEYYYTLAGGWNNYWGLVLTDGSFGYTNTGGWSTFRLYKADGSYLSMPINVGGISCDNRFIYYQYGLPYNLGDGSSYKLLRIDPAMLTFSGVYPYSYVFSVPYNGYSIIRTAGLADNLWYFPGQWSSSTNLWTG